LTSPSIELFLLVKKMSDFHIFITEASPTGY